MGVGVGGLSNSQIAELLAPEAEKVSGQLRMAFRRAARPSCIWPVEILDWLAQAKPLTILPGIGPFLEKTHPRLGRSRDARARYGLLIS